MISGFVDYDKRLEYTKIKQKQITQMKKQIILEKLKIIISLFLLVLLFFTNFSTAVFAQSSSSNQSSSQAPVVSSNCEVGKNEIRWWQITTPGQFLPVIPEECATEDGKPKPLSLDILPDILIRFFGFIVSLIWLLLLPVFIFAGIWYIWGGFDGQGSENARNLIKTSLFGILTLFMFYVAVFTVLTLLQANFLETDISTFFTAA